MKYFLYILAVCTIFPGICNTTFSQSLSNIIQTTEELFELTEQQYGANDLLYNGRKHIPPHPLASGHPNLLSNEWVDATIYINNSKFENYNVNYNIELDRIVFQANLESGISVDILLNTTIIDSIHLNNRTLINNKYLGINDSIANFFEPIFLEDISMIATYNKEFKAEFKEWSPNGYYTDTKSRYYIYWDNTLYKVFTKRAFLELFNEKKKKVKKQMKALKIKYNNTEGKELSLLMKYINGLYQEK